MQPSLETYKLLAFICAMKARRRNSCLYGYEKAYVVAKQIGISVYLYKRLLKECVTEGLFVDGKFLGLRQVMVILFPYRADQKYIRFFKGWEKTTDFKTYYARIKLALLITNAGKQQYRINQNETLERLRTDRNNAVPPKKHLRALYKRHGVNCLEDLLKCTAPGLANIVTGRYHTSGLLGCSPATGSRLLRKWAREGSIEREIVVEFRSMPTNNTTFDLLKSEGNRYIVPNKKRTGFYLNKGSVIRITTTGNLVCTAL